MFPRVEATHSSLAESATIPAGWAAPPTLGTGSVMPSAHLYLPSACCRADAHLVLGVADVDGLALHDQANNAEATRHGKRLLDRAGRQLDELECGEVFHDQGAAVLDQRKIDRPAGKGDLLTRWLEDLVGRHNDPAIRLDPYGKSVEALRAPRRSREGHREIKGRRKAPVDG